jgi:DamX protein
MENSKPSDPRKTVGWIIASLDKRVGALEGRLGEMPASPGDDEADPGQQGPPRSGAPGEPAASTSELAEVAAGPAARGKTLEEVETALIGRIADVDDDRRRSAGILKRALETHQEEVSIRVRRSGRWTAALALSAIALSLFSAWFVLRHGAIGAAAMSDELAQLRGEVARLGAIAGEADPSAGRLTALSEVVKELSDTLETLDAEQEQALQSAFARESGERQTADADMQTRLERLEAVQEGLGADMASLRATLVEPAAQGAGAQVPDIVAGDRPGPASDMSPDGAGPQAGERAETQAELISPQPEPLAQAAEPPPGDRPVEASGPADGHGAGQMASQGDEADPQPTEVPVAGDPGDAPGEADAQIVTGEDPSVAEATDAASLDAARAELSEADAIIIAGERQALQLIGFFSLEELRRFADRDDLPVQMYYRRETLRGRPWYVLIHSLHRDVASAQEARAGLPADVAGMDLWVRPLADFTRLEVLRRGGESAPSPE